MKLFKILFIFTITATVDAQVPNIPPSMLNQMQNMSENEISNMAQQYGVSPGLLMPQSIVPNEDLGDRADAISNNPEKIMYERLMRTKSNEEKLNDFDKKYKPIFERDYLDTADIPVYGRSIFDNQVTTYASVDNAPVPDDYRLGIGDSLNIILYGSENIERELKVDRSGEVNFPKIGNLKIAGMTFGQVREYVQDRVSNELIGVKVNISFGSLRSINVFVAGEGRVPGAYSVSALSTVSQVLFVAGGVSEIGSLRNIEVKNNGFKKATFDLYKLLTDGNTEGDIRLQSGDVIFIPPVIKTVIIEGAVRREGRYELIKNEKLAELIKLAGGLDSRAFLKQIYVERYTNDLGLPTIINLDISSEKDFIIEDGDIVRIAHVNSNSKNSVVFRGALERPGKYGWYQGIRLSDFIKNVDIDLLENADLDHSLIVRRKNQNTNDIYTISFNLSNAIINPGSDFDPLLNPSDEVFIFAMAEGVSFLDNLLPKSKDIMQMSDGGLNEINEIVINEDQEEMILGPDGKIQILMTDEKYNKLLAEKKFQMDREIEQRGNRAELLEPILRKLYRQADTNEAVQVVSISGAVKMPGEYPLVNNSSFSNLIDLAGGYTDDALMERAELRRLQINPDGSIETVLSQINLTKDNLNIRLSSRDHLRINKIKDWDINDSIEIKGEVFYPGRYLISPNETLSSVIKRAGGFTDESFINAAIFTRESIKDKEREQLLVLGNNIRRDQASRSMTKESEDFSVSSKEIEDSIEALLSTEVIGRLIIDLPRVINGDPLADLILQDGDILEIPKYTNAVTVVGEVRRSGSFVRQESFKIDDYIELAAGLTQRGDKKQTYIIRADGSVEKIDGLKERDFFNFSDSNSGVMAGDTIVVPIKSSYQTPLNLYSTVSQVVFQSIASIAAFSTIFN
jgi:polysaccharide biosynthesis/export protein